MIENIYVVALAVGQGMCNLIEGYENGFLRFLGLLDCGTYNGISIHDQLSFDCINEVIEYIRSKMEERAKSLSFYTGEYQYYANEINYFLDLIVISHSDQDHFNLIPDLFKNMNYPFVLERTSEIDEGLTKFKKKYIEPDESFYFNRNLEIVYLDSSEMKDIVENSKYEFLKSNNSIEEQCIIGRYEEYGEYDYNSNKYIFNFKKITPFDDRISYIISVDLVDELMSLGTFKCELNASCMFMNFKVYLEHADYEIRMNNLYKFNHHLSLLIGSIEISLYYSNGIVRNEHINQDPIIVNQNDDIETFINVFDAVIEVFRTLESFNKEFEVFDNIISFIKYYWREINYIRVFTITFQDIITNFFNSVPTSDDSYNCVIDTAIWGGHCDYLKSVNSVNDSKQVKANPQISSSIIKALSSYVIEAKEKISEHFLCENMYLYIYGYDEHYYRSLNDKVIVNATSFLSTLTLKFGKEKILNIAVFPGDITVDSMFWFNESCPSADKVYLYNPKILMAPHHGSIHSAIKNCDTSILEKFLYETILPCNIFVSAAHNSVYGHPSYSFIDICKSIFSVECEQHDCFFNTNDHGKSSKINIAVSRTNIPIYTNAMSDKTGQILCYQNLICEYYRSRFKILFEESFLNDPIPKGKGIYETYIDFDINQKVDAAEFSYLSPDFIYEQ